MFQLRIWDFRVGHFLFLLAAFMGEAAMTTSWLPRLLPHIPLAYSSRRTSIALCKTAKYIGLVGLDPVDDSVRSFDEPAGIYLTHQASHVA